MAHEHVEEYHHHDAPQSGSNVLGWVVAIILIVLVIIFGIPAIRSVANYSNPQSAGTQINVPDKINVNVTTPEQK